MHRTYSMRQSRAPTASQIQNPPPPSSTTKAGRFFGKNNIGQSNPLPISSYATGIPNVLTGRRRLPANICHRTQIPPTDCWRFRSRSCKEALAARQDGEERDAQHGACWPRAHGGRSTRHLYLPLLPPANALSSNNSQFGVRDVTTMYQMSPTSLVS